MDASQHTFRIGSGDARTFPRPLAATAVTRAFESWAPLKLVGQLRSSGGGDAQQHIRSKAIVAARDLLLSPLTAAQCIAAGIIPALVALLGEAAAAADRVEALRTLEALVKHSASARTAARETELLAAPVGLLLLAPASSGNGAAADSEAAAEAAAAGAAATRRAALGVLQAGCEHDSFRAALALQPSAVAALLSVARAGLLVGVAPQGGPGDGAAVLATDGAESVQNSATRALAVLISCVQAHGSKGGAEAASAIVRAGGLQPLSELLLHGKGHPNKVLMRLRACAAALISEVLLERPDTAARAVGEGCVAAAVELLRSALESGGVIIAADDVVSTPIDPAAAAAAALMALTRPREGKVAFLAAAGSTALLTESIRAAACATAGAAMAAALPPLLQACANAAELAECRAALGAAGAPAAIQAAIDATAGGVRGDGAPDGDGRHALVMQSAADALKLLGFKHHPHV